MSQENGPRRLAKIEDSVEALIQQLEEDIEKSGGKLITVTRNKTDYTRINRTEINREQK